MPTPASCPPARRTDKTEITTIAAAAESNTIIIISSSSSRSCLVIETAAAAAAAAAATARRADAAVLAALASQSVGEAAAGDAGGGVSRPGGRRRSLRRGKKGWVGHRLVAGAPQSEGQVRQGPATAEDFAQTEGSTPDSAPASKTEFAGYQAWPKVGPMVVMGWGRGRGRRQGGRGQKMHYTHQTNQTAMIPTRSLGSRHIHPRLQDGSS